VRKAEKEGKSCIKQSRGKTFKTFLERRKIENSTGRKWSNILSAHKNFLFQNVSSDIFLVSVFHLSRDGVERECEYRNLFEPPPSFRILCSIASVKQVFGFFHALY
jgi:hypothetical protein